MGIIRVDYKYIRPQKSVSGGNGVCIYIGISKYTLYYYYAYIYYYRRHPFRFTENGRIHVTRRERSRDIMNSGFRKIETTAAQCSNNTKCHIDVLYSQ